MNSGSYELAPLTGVASGSFIALILMLAAILLLIRIRKMPATAKSAASGLLLVTLAGSVWVFWQAQASKVELTAQSLVVEVPFYGQSLAPEHLRISEAKVINLGDASGPRLGMRTQGIGLPGYTLGWYRLNDGSKAFVALTEKDSVLLLPTDLGYSLLLSMPEAESLLEGLGQNLPG
ncbi:PH domain-containing protein [Shewanella algae]|uniref:PH domain-containing protein n=1 Tax=Shewanella algae TaxID=38313 RepID=UPI001181CDE9|nr:PH domain-containing protein [Shewanella algae]MBO2585049.1 hypothetical protein [Shewanella algae]TVK91655.1 hypothetical protein AYJ01_18255 [Shewanella algae]